MSAQYGQNNALNFFIPDQMTREKTLYTLYKEFAQRQIDGALQEEQKSRKSAGNRTVRRIRDEGGGSVDNETSLHMLHLWLCNEEEMVKVTDAGKNLRDYLANRPRTLQSFHSWFGQNELPAFLKGIQPVKKKKGNTARNDGDEDEDQSEEEEDDQAAIPVQPVRERVKPTPKSRRPPPTVNVTDDDEEQDECGDPMSAPTFTAPPPKKARTKAAMMARFDLGQMGPVYSHAPPPVARAAAPADPLSSRSMQVPEFQEAMDQDKVILKMDCNPFVEITRNPHGIPIKINCFCAYNTDRVLQVADHIKKDRNVVTWDEYLRHAVSDRALDENNRGVFHAKYGVEIFNLHQTFSDYMARGAPNNGYYHDYTISKTSLQRRFEASKLQVGILESANASVLNMKQIETAFFSFLTDKGIVDYVKHRDAQEKVKEIHKYLATTKYVESTQDYDMFVSMRDKCIELIKRGYVKPDAFDGKLIMQIFDASFHALSFKTQDYHIRRLVAEFNQWFTALHMDTLDENAKVKEYDEVSENLTKMRYFFASAYIEERTWGGMTFEDKFSHYTGMWYDCQDAYTLYKSSKVAVEELETKIQHLEAKVADMANTDAAGYQKRVDSLITENSNLKEEIAVLKAEIAKLQSARPEVDGNSGPGGFSAPPPVTKTSTKGGAGAAASGKSLVSAPPTKARSSEPMSANDPAPQVSRAGRVRKERERWDASVGTSWSSNNSRANSRVTSRVQTRAPSPEPKPRFTPRSPPDSPQDNNEGPVDGGIDKDGTVKEKDTRKGGKGKKHDGGGEVEAGENDGEAEEAGKDDGKEDGETDGEEDGKEDGEDDGEEDGKEDEEADGEDDGEDDGADGDSGEESQSQVFL